MLMVLHLFLENIWLAFAACIVLIVFRRKINMIYLQEFIRSVLFIPL